MIPIIRGQSSGWRRALSGGRSLGPAQLVHGLDVDLPARPRSPTVATLHDLSVFDVPWAFSRRRAMGERLLVKTALRRADAVIAVSAFTAERVRQLFGREAVVIHEAPGPDMHPPLDQTIRRVRSRYGLPDHFVLHVGSLEPRKDLSCLEEACRLAAVPLVLAGGTAWGVRMPVKAIHLGHVPRDDLPGLYGASTIVAYVSRYEGFGLPPLEAMACGAPVVCTRVPAVAEVVKEGAWVVNQGDPTMLASAISELLRDKERRQELAASGAESVRLLSWDTTARSTADVYRQLGVDV